MDQVFISRKIEIIIDESDVKKRKEHFDKIMNWRNLVRRSANIIVSHKFVQKNVADFEYLTDEAKEKIKVSDIIKQEPGMSVQNVTYRKLARAFGKEVPSDILTSLNQAVSKSFNETYPQVKVGESSLRSYKNCIPIPFSASSLRKFKEVRDDENGKFKHYSFVIYGIPFRTFFGKRDHSDNRTLLARCFDENYPDFIFRSFSLVVDTSGEKTKIFMTAVIQRPTEVVDKENKKTMYAQLSVNTPIICSANPSAIPYMTDYTLYEQRQNLMELAKQIKEFDRDLGKKTKEEIDQLYTQGKGVFPHIIPIGTKEEFLHRRIQIQRAVRRCQKDNRYAANGKGKKRKCQALERWHKIEHNYVESKMHIYAKKLVQEARSNGCSTIVLCKQEERELEAKNDHKFNSHFLLRNWSYYGLKEKIKYKAAQLGIRLVEELSAKSIVVYFEGEDYTLVKNFCKATGSKKFKVTSDTVKIHYFEKYDIVYMGITAQVNEDMLNTFIDNNIVKSQVIVPLECKDIAEPTANIRDIQSAHSDVEWWKETIKAHQLTEKEMKALHYTISDSMDL